MKVALPAAAAVGAPRARSLQAAGGFAGCACLVRLQWCFLASIICNTCSVGHAPITAYGWLVLQLSCRECVPARPRCCAEPVRRTGWHVAGAQHTCTAVL